MQSRMSKYNGENQNSTVKSRLTKNQTIYTDEVDDILSTRKPDYNVIEIDKNVGLNLLKREEYKKNKELQKIFDNSENNNQEIEEPQDAEEQKIYDINAIIERAKQQRKEKDNLEFKRKLKNDDYNIFDGNSIEELKERKNTLDKQKNDIDELINKISSQDNTEETGGLLDDLMDTVSKSTTELNEYSSKTILDTNINEETEKKESTFFTKSVELTDKDFETDQEKLDDFMSNKQKKSHPVLKILLFILLIAIVCVGLYFIYKNK